MVYFNEIIQRLKKKFNKNRFEHILGVAKTAIEIAKREGIDIDAAKIAGLLHDYAKDMDENELRRLVKLSSWEIDEVEMAIPQLLHAPVGSYLVEKELGINNKEILEAIRYHTIGSPGMGKLAQIIYIADYIEPNRKFPGVDEARKETAKGLIYGIFYITSNTIKYNINKNNLIHPNTLLLRNEYLRRITLYEKSI